MLAGEGLLQAVKVSDITSGKKKKELTSWWLNHIQTRANEFLQEKRYNFKAVPDNYIEQRPASFEDVKANLALIREILNPKEDIHRVQDLVRTLTAEIYPRIEEYLLGAQLVLCREFNRPNKPFDLAPIEKLFEKSKSKLGDAKVKWITNLINDIKYIEEMKEMEKKFSTKGVALEVSDVVPISGLIIGHFHIMENILKTILEVWGIEDNVVRFYPEITTPRNNNNGDCKTVPLLEILNSRDAEELIALYTFPHDSPATRHDRRADWKKKRAARSFLLTTIEKGYEFQRENEDIFAKVTPPVNTNTRSAPVSFGSQLQIPNRISPITSPRTSPKSSPRVMVNPTPNTISHFFVHSPSPKRPSIKKFLGVLKHTVSETKLSSQVNQTSS